MQQDVNHATENTSTPLPVACHPRNFWGKRTENRAISSMWEHAFDISQGVGHAQLVAYKSKGKPSIDDIMKHWSEQDASSDWLLLGCCRSMLPVQIPQPEPGKVKANDQFKIDMDFVKQSIIPACNQVGCV